MFILTLVHLGNALLDSCLKAADFFAEDLVLQLELLYHFCEVDYGLNDLAGNAANLLLHEVQRDRDVGVGLTTLWGEVRSLLRLMLMRLLQLWSCREVIAARWRTKRWRRSGIGVVWDVGVLARFVGMSLKSLLTGQ